MIKKELVISKRVTGINGFLVFYNLIQNDWPEFISRKCGDCHNWTPIKTCTFHEELADAGYLREPNRVRTKLSNKTVACPWFIPRSKRWRDRNLQNFMTLIRSNDNVAENKGQPHYVCFFCNEPLGVVDFGFFPQIGSSVFRCGYCESMYKLVFKEKKNEFRMLFTEEKGHLYRENFVNAAGIFSLVEPYSSMRYGIIVPEKSSCKIIFDSETIRVENWVGKLGELEYIVAKTLEAFDFLRDQLEKDYKHIRVIYGGEKIFSPPPREQQIGLLQLLREYMLLNKGFCLAILGTRIAVIEALSEYCSPKSIQDAILTIKELQRQVKEAPVLSVLKWNEIEMNAGKAMWDIVTEILEKKGWEVLGRCSGRYVREPFKPYRLYYAYVKVDAIINGLFSKMQDEIKEYCSKIGFCWDGLPGICHKETHGGILGFHLDQAEPFKVLTLPSFIEAVENEELDLTEMSFFYGRRRQKIFGIWPDSKLDDQIKKIVQDTLRRKVEGKRIEKLLERYYFETKVVLANLERRSNNYTVTHHGKHFSLWAVKPSGIWDYLPKVERRKGREYLRESIDEMRFKPITIREMN